MADDELSLFTDYTMHHGVLAKVIRAYAITTCTCCRFTDAAHLLWDQFQLLVRGWINVLIRDAL